MARAGVLLALALLAPVPLRSAEPMLYRIELAGGQTILARTPPVPRASRLVFSRHPDGAVMSLKREDVRRIVSVAAGPAPKAGVREIRPGTLVVLGPTGEGSAGTQSAGEASASRPGAAPDGRALLNPQRDYRPDWDSRQVPGQNLPYPASPGDYREGRTMSYPPGGGTQSGTGQPPTGVPSGPPPKSP
ncbi:MAG: hypothetical protein ABI610_13910 [Acidobacteriota bacterium]